ncbi:MAG: ComF family protein [Candidatus Paraimprobicoccus trichonymphae]|uniref:ComF family protein n=1 Tax=Candidatus Paraimprobicoccus trichonymphae TaxID=3033793 RepID=A0AA48I678_9FIRM|nr:MAG: ComF family protein [Candidatus Paraimprobicoccus trichonymphae]
MCPYCEKILKISETCVDCLEKTRDNSKFVLLSEENLENPCYCIAALKYNTLVKNAVWNFKFKGIKSYSEQLSCEMFLAVNRVFQNMKFDYITCVPLHKDKKLIRGYNQAEALARDLGKKLNVKYIDLIIKTKNNKAQHDLNLKDRIENIKNVFDINKSIEISENSNILICDDILTTGNTLKECVKVLYNSGFKNIQCTSIAYVTTNN